MAKYFYSPAKQKAVLLLAAGVILGLNRSPKVQWKIIKNLPKVWKYIDRNVLRRLIKEFKQDRLIDFEEKSDGTIRVVLTEKGERRALRFDPERIFIKKPLRWDGKWRMIIFDIPEKKRAARDAMRIMLAKAGFRQLQRSVWVHPYECKNELDFIVEFFEIRNYVHYCEVNYLTNDSVLRLHFDLA